MKPGIYDHLSEAEYFGSDAISKHGLDLIARSPAHYMQNKVTPRVTTDAMLVGKLFHIAALEPERWATQPYVVVSDDCKRNTKEGKAEYADAEVEAAERGGVPIVKRSVIAGIENMVLALLEHRGARKALRCEGRAETSLFAEDPEFGVLRRSRIDWLPTSGNAIVDLKKSRNARMEEFARDMATYRYHVQASFYLDMAALCGLEREEFIFVVCEDEPPYGVATYQLDLQDMEAGREEYRRNLALYAECREMNHWPAYSQDIVRITLPGWKRRQLGISEN